MRRGDTLYAISRRHGLPLRALIAANGLKPPFRLAAGQKLRIPETRYYVVGEGDTVYKLSRQFKVKPAHIIKANRIRTQDHMLYPGQKLLIPSTRQKPVAHTNIKVARAITPDKPDSTTPAIKAHAMAVPSPSLKAPAITKRRNPEAKPKAASKAKAKVQRASIPAPPPPPKRKAAPKKRAALPPRVGGFVWPVKGKLLSSYGKKGNGLYNDGINIEAKNGTPVRAVESGIVAYAGNELKGYGNLLLIRHDGGWISAYAHNGEILVSKGDVVRRGQTVAKVGQSGAVDKPQLHFELRRGPRAVNPLDHLKNTKS
ncbi:MAG TPA: LysM peptidoglycan-binding domain-containing M23 family metallopeptidase [Alphaproteobacteria bacterium]|nr:LysM peptidoglycan-binding domain-containing M23 family metallopeptidase [Alphaproteobacteria bacterium]